MPLCTSVRVSAAPAHLAAAVSLRVSSKADGTVPRLFRGSIVIQSTASLEPICDSARSGDAVCWSNTVISSFCRSKSRISPDCSRRWHRSWSQCKDHGGWPTRLVSCVAKVALLDWHETIPAA